MGDELIGSQRANCRLPTITAFFKSLAFLYIYQGPHTERESDWLQCMMSIKDFLLCGIMELNY